MYRVFEVLIVKPGDTWVLQPSGEDKLITLVTCDYSQEPSVRLIVRGKLVEDDSHRPPVASAFFKNTGIYTLNLIPPIAYLRFIW